MCEKCWEEVNSRISWTDCGRELEFYKRLLEKCVCTPEEQAGKRATECPNCKRITVNWYTPFQGKCRACGFEPPRSKHDMHDVRQYSQAAPTNGGNDGS